MKLIEERHVMRYLITLLSLAISSLVVTPILAQESGVTSATATCPDGTVISNGVEIRVNMRPGFTYTATALGMGGFDPIIAVSDANGVQRCADDSPRLGDYSADLPTTGRINGAATNAQVPISHNFNSFADISIIVGGQEGETGEFLLILEGMAVTSADGQGEGAGDPFAARLTQNMVNSGVPLTVYMLAKRNDVDPFIQFVDAESAVITLNDGTRVECDDAGDTSLCWGDSSDLSASSVGGTRGRATDAMISIPITGFPLDRDPALNFFNYLMTSYRQESYGDYIVAFHIGIGDREQIVDNGTGIIPLVPTPSVQDKSSSLRVGSSGGIELRCPDGTAITNAVEVGIVLPRGATYTATAMGIRGFDPIMAIRDANGRITCEDDSRAAIRYTANLPTTGFIRNADTNAQAMISQQSSAFADVSIIIGGYDGADGQFALVIEGMDISEEDGAGDPYAVRITPNMIGSGVPLSIYMLGADRALDPFIQLVHTDGTPVELNHGTRVECDDGGDDSICFGESSSLVGSFVAGAGSAQVQGRETSAMLSIPLDVFDPTVDPELSFLNFTMTSYGQDSTGNYVLVFHIGIGQSAAPPPDTESNI